MLAAATAMGAVSRTVPLPGPDRLRADRAAKTSFLNLNFFSGGDGMHMPPGMIELAERAKDFTGGWRLLQRRWGLQRENTLPVGLFNVSYRGMQVGVLGCAVCHSGRAAGQFVVGLGNKNIDTSRMGSDVLRIERTWSALARLRGPASPDYLRVQASALDFARTLSDPRIGNFTQGLVPTAFIRSWFYQVEGASYPPDLHRGAVKVPSLWGYGEKRAAGQFCDGYGDGERPGWAVAVELVGGQKPDRVRALLPKIEAAERLLADFLPPRYPFAVEGARAARGKSRFERTCAQCHGTYESDPAGLPVFRAPNWIPWETVRTDPDRLDGNTPEFQASLERSPLRDLIRTRVPGRGYFAPRLLGIWSRFPYLHNGSIPSLNALLTPPAKRPRVFSLRDAGERSRFDPLTLGLSLPPAGSREESMLRARASQGARDVYWVERLGHSNQGHDFYTELGVEERRDLIEYLKTL